MTAQTFYTELSKLLKKYPTPQSDITDSEDSEYGNYIHFCKNMYIAFDCANSTDCLYTYDGYIVKNCVDTDYCTETELCYENVDSFKCFNSDYLEYCSSMQDCAYASDCINCNNVFGCVGLSNKSYCIFNRQLTQEEYKQKISFYKSWPPEKVLAMVEELKKRYPSTVKEGHNENSPYGHYIHYDKNCYMCFDAAHDEDCSYLYDSHYNTSCFDMTYCSQKSELTYEAVDSFKLFNCSFAVLCGNSQDSSYIFNCNNVKDCFGCVSLTNKQYCILNRQLTKEQYETTISKIKEELKLKNMGWSALQFS